jgi:multicomponent Na+:H+ antiporter subunit A
MNNLELFLTITVGFIVAGAIVALETENMFAAVLAWGGACLSLSVVFVLLNALDLAMVQLVVEIIIITLLLRATGSLESSIKRETSIVKAMPRYLTAILLAGCFACFIYFALKELPPFGLPIFKSAQTILTNGERLSGYTYLASAVFTKIRALDAFAVSALLFAGLLGALSLLRAKGHK